jgi:23S rRNA pseudouridine2605 synthase
LRLNQAIAQTGLCSRRKADELIAAGRVRVNGIACTDFSRDVDPDNDALDVDGKLLSFKTYTYVALHKPVGVVTTTSDEQDRETVIDLLPAKLRHLKPVGRLDMYSEGLLILTNDGDFALKLTHPRHHLPKLYSIQLRGSLSDKHANMIAKGVPLEDGKTLPAKVRIVERNKTYTEVEITLVEGRNRQIRRMFAYLGYTVLRLVRLAIGGLQLGQAAPGTWRYLTTQEVASLINQSNDANDA